MGSSINTTTQNKHTHDKPKTAHPFSAFRSEIRASGAGETWSHADDGNAKFQQFGWRCTNDENAYKEDVLIGNWNEKQFDVARLKSNVKMSSPYGHRYETTYNAAYIPDTVAEQGQSRLDMKKRIIKLEKEGIDRSFPAHQPELYIVPKQEMITTSQLAYGIGTKDTKSKSKC